MLFQGDVGFSLKVLSHIFAGHNQDLILNLYIAVHKNTPKCVLVQVHVMSMLLRTV
jgi:hypothetical protein